MASGIPVIASNATSIPEIAGGAALLVDPLNVDEIASGMQQIVCDSDLRAACRQSGLMQSRRFDWERPADRLRCILSDAAASRSAH
jgi:glycosyltransferase involved in cell wall biosynthesis